MKRRKQLKTMKQRQQLAAIGVLAVAAIAALAFVALSNRPDGEQAGMVEVMPAELSAEGEAGEALFKANCMACHGERGAGTKLGPPLIHDIYNPGHHSDEAFYLAAAIGVRQHHWNFGDMPAQPQVRREDVELIVRYVRELQEANGIVYKRHGM